MDHSFGLNTLVLVLVFAPLIAFFYKCYQLGQQMPSARVDELLTSWKDPAPLHFNLPFELVCQTVVQELPKFSYANGAWQIINVEDGIPTTIAANLPCLDESDPGNVQRLDVGLITTVTDQGPQDSGVMVRLHFIPYEGAELPLKAIGERTYDHVDKALQRKAASLYATSGIVEQPRAVPGEITYQASSGAPSEPASDFFAQSNDYAPTDSPSVVSAAQAQSFTPAPAPQPLPEPFVVPAPIAMPEPIALQDVMPASPAGSGDGASLCPGCSQPINPSFPFCLYCGKNF